MQVAIPVNVIPHTPGYYKVIGLYQGSGSPAEVLEKFRASLIEEGTTIEDEFRYEIALDIEVRMFLEGERDGVRFHQALGQGWYLITKWTPGTSFYTVYFARKGA